MSMLRLSLLAALSAALLVVVAPAASGNPAGNATCAGGDLAGTYRNLTITGGGTGEDSAPPNVTGNLTLASGSVFNAVTLGTVTVGGNVLVGQGAIFGLGCTVEGVGCADNSHDVVKGNVIATNAMTMYLDGNEIWGNVVSTGGGPGPTFDPYVNFPIKDNIIHGNVVVNGWQGAWFGFIRNVTFGNVILTNNVGVNPDSTEVVTSTISGNLICKGNQPVAQLGDSGGTPNTVGGK